jgi:coatomer subunit beta'
VVGLWKEKLAATNQKAAQSLADPAEYENLFPGLQEAVRAEQLLKNERSRLLPASAFPSVTSPCDRNILEELRSGQLGSTPPLPTEATPTKQETTPTPPDEEEDFDLNMDEDLDLDDLDLNADEIELGEEGDLLQD